MLAFIRALLAAFILAGLTFLGYLYWPQQERAPVPLPGMAALQQTAQDEPALELLDEEEADDPEAGDPGSGETGTGEPALALDPANDLYARDPLTLTNIVCPFNETIDYKPGEISCSLLRVPENREDPASRMIELHVVKIEATPEDDNQSAVREDPVLYLTGGPSVKVDPYVRRLKDHGVLKHRALYLLEQRGIGFSGDFCPFVGARNPMVSNVETVEERGPAFIAQMKACLEAASAKGVDLNGYSTIENARDVRSLRLALERRERANRNDPTFEFQWNIWGISYGSYLGQAYLKEDEGGIRSIVLDAIVPLDRDFNTEFLRSSRSYSQVLEKLAGACGRDDQCAANFPNFVERLRDALVAVNADPIVVQAVDTELFPKGSAWYFAELVGGLPFLMLYEQDHYPAMPAFISALADIVETRDYERFRILTASGGYSASSSPGMQAALLCRDGWAMAYGEAVRQDQVDYPKLSLRMPGADTFRNLSDECAAAGIPPRPDADYRPISTDVPALIANGDMDPITPPEFAEEIAPGFANLNTGSVIVFPYAGHGPTRSVECAGDLLTAFFDNPTVPVDTSCADGRDRPDFTGPLYVNGALPALAASFLEEPRSVAVPGGMLAFSAVILILSALVLTFAPIGRLIDGEDANPTGGARIIAWLTAVSGSGALFGIGVGYYLSFEAIESMPLLGAFYWVEWFTWAGLAAGVFGVLTIMLTLVASRDKEKPQAVGSVIGFLLTGLAGISLALALLLYGFTRF